MLTSLSGSRLVPVALLLFGASMWGIIWYPLRLLEQAGLAGLWQTLIIFGTALVVGLPFLWQRRSELAHRPDLALLIALANGWCNTSFILAVLEGNVVRVMLLFYLSPLWTVVLGRFILGERLSLNGVATVGLALGGALTMLWNPTVGLPWPQGWAEWLAISSGFAFALSNVLMRKMQEISVRTKTVIAWFGVVILCIVWLRLEDLPLPDVGVPVLAMAFLLGAVAMVLMSLAVVYGVTHMPAQRSAVILLFELVVGAVSAQLLTDERVEAIEWFGGLLIVAAAWISARGAAAASGSAESPVRPSSPAP